MSTEKETLQRVQGGLYHLRRGLTPFVEARMKARHGANWLGYASRAAGGSTSAALDEYGLLKTMIDNWRDAFDDAFGRNDKHKVRNFTSMALEARNATSHLSIPLQDDEALRYLDAIHCLLKAVKAPAAEVNEAKALYDAQRRSGFGSAEPSATATASPAAAIARPTLSLGAGPAAPLETGPAKALRPWIEVALPHPDVLANRFKEAEFAADLFAVDAGHAGEDYASPENFFRITFLTEGLRRILTSSLQRLSGSGGDPVIGLQTAFGGGKTHTMLAVYHLAKSRDLSLLEGVGPLSEKAGVTGWTAPKVAVFVGTSKGADTSLILRDGPKVHTLWGYIAWRIAGQAGLDLMAEAEAARTNPGSDLLVELFKLSGPTLILLDELVAYARQLSEDRFEAFLSFIQSLTEAAKMAPGVLIIGSLPESVAEAGGPNGEAALLRLEKVFGRVQSAWLPASGDETYEIIRRRLFQTLDADGERARDDTVKAFADLYKNNPAEFPPEAKEARYRDLLKLSYPIHPELFDRLSKDWASLEKFQRTRGVLRFMANVVGTLWQMQVSDQLITPARVPISHERVRASGLYPLDSNYNAVVDKEVDGESSLPARMEANPSRRISQLRAATRAARAVFVCSAPLVGRPNAGLTGPGLRLACAEPGDQLAIFGEALRELTERATYLFEEAGRYWFSTQPTLNRLADDRAKALPDHEVNEAIVKVLREDGATKAGFHRVFAAPDDPIRHGHPDALPLGAAPMPQHPAVRRRRRGAAGDGARGDAQGHRLAVDLRRPALAGPAEPRPDRRHQGEGQDEPRRRGQGRPAGLEPHSVPHPGGGRRDGLRPRSPFDRVQGSRRDPRRRVREGRPAGRQHRQGNARQRRARAAPETPLARRAAALGHRGGGGLVHLLRLSPEVARPRRAGERDPGRRRQARPGVRLRRPLRRGSRNLCRLGLGQTCSRNLLTHGGSGAAGDCRCTSHPASEDAGVRGSSIGRQGGGGRNAADR